jgi:hypothetical protein
MKTILLFLAVILSMPVLAQNDAHDITLFQSISDSRNLYFGLMPKSSGTKGSPFIFDDMLRGDIIMANGKIYQGVYINILPEKAEVFIRSEEEENAKVVIIENKKLEKIIYDGSERIFLPMEVAGKSQIAEVLADGEEGKFIAIHEKKFNKANVGGAYNAGPKYDTYQHVIRYFIIRESGEEEIKSGKTGLKTLAKDEWKNLQNFIKSNNLDMGNPMDMRKIYFHSLAL